MKSVPLYNVTAIVTGIQVVCQRLRQYSMSSSGLKPQQLYPCTVHTSDDIRWPVSCFVHNLTWWACQLIHADDDSKHPKVLRDLIQRDPEVRSLFRGTNALPRELPECLRVLFVILLFKHNSLAGGLETVAQIGLTINSRALLVLLSNIAQ